MRIVFDTNVILDVILQREPHFEEAAALLAYVEENALEGQVGATTVTTVFYFARRRQDAIYAHEVVQLLLDLFGVAPVTEVVLRKSLSLGFTDYEDAVLHEAARHVRSDGIVTRNQKDFAQAQIPIYSPSGLLTLIEKE